VPDDSLASALEEFRRQFIRGSFDRLREMDAAVDRASAADAWEVNVAELSRHFHGLAGSGGTYGFSEVSRDANRGEIICQAVLGEARRPTTAELSGWRDLISAIRTSLASGGSSSSWMPLSARPAPAVSVLVVDDDSEYRAMLARLCDREGFLHREAGSLAEARRALDSEIPDALLLDIGLPDGRGFELVEELRNRPGGESVAVLVVSGLAGFEDRVEAIHCGADGYFQKPVEAEALLRRLHHLLDRSQSIPPRILSVEDEPEQANVIRAVLESAGYDVRVCSGARDFPTDLETFRPDLVLMDARLPDASGYELARYIRQEERYATLPVIFLTAEVLPSHRIEGLRAGGDDYLTKPISPSLLLSTVGARLERSRFLKTLLLNDGLTRLLTHTAFLERVRTEAARLARVEDPRACLVMVDLDQFKTINDLSGHPAGDRVLASFASILRRRFRQSDAIGRLGGDEFGILLVELSLDEALRLVERLRTEFASTVHGAEIGKPVRATFSAGIASFKPPAMDFRSWVASADAAVYEAKSQGRDRIVAK
jgi:diguanylate cyclase (GGDEF)-like protein